MSKGIPLKADSLLFNATANKTKSINRPHMIFRGGTRF